MSVLEQVRSDTTAAMKAGEKERVGALRMIVNELQKAEKEGGADEIAVLQRERKRRLESAEAYREAGRTDLAEGEEREAALIEAYLPEQLSDAELGELVSAAIEETGATEQGQMGQVMSAVMPKVGGRADGKRVSQVVRERLGA